MAKHDAYEHATTSNLSENVGASVKYEWDNKQSLRIRGSKGTI